MTSFSLETLNLKHVHWTLWEFGSLIQTPCVSFEEKCINNRKFINNLAGAYRLISGYYACHVNNPQNATSPIISRIHARISGSQCGVLCILQTLPKYKEDIFGNMTETT